MSLPTGELRRLAATHVALAPETQHMLDAMPILLRDLPSSAQRIVAEDRGRIRTPVDWASTQVRRRTTGDPTLFVSRPTTRMHDTPLGRLARYGLRRCADLEGESGLEPSGELGAYVAETSRRARHLLSHAKLRDVVDLTTVPERALMAVGRFPAWNSLVEFCRLVQHTLIDLEPRSIFEVLSRHAISPSRSDTLFELVVGFEIVDALIASGFSDRPGRLIPGPAPLARLEKGDQRATLWWQKSVWSARQASSSKTSAFQRILREAGLVPSRLRPDFVLVVGPPERILFFEVKLSLVGAAVDRDGVRDGLAYLYDASEELAGFPTPYGVVVAWDSQGLPSLSSELLLVGQNRVKEAVALALQRWDAA
jgi:hypothetical protein